MNTISIREAIASDLDFILELMQSALEPFYGGDHKAHGRRIFDAHMAGGQDFIGHFSYEQRMFIATHEGQPIGMLHIVGKKQGTFKISPLIVAEDYRGGYGVGGRLLDAAEQYARSFQARQIYCTVAAENNLALGFFRRNGYIQAGQAMNHYKVGMLELMLYKPLDLPQESELGISVIPFDESYAQQVADMVIYRLSQGFFGVDDDWMQALYEGYARRLSGDINTKYKLIFMAVDSNGEVCGVAGATPKKGQPIKLMPLVATTSEAFYALVADLPTLLRDYGHKLYTHILPTVQETMILQRFGWKLEGLLPAAYHTDVVTQQWGTYIGDTEMKTLRIKPKYFNMIRQGKKTVEVRVGYNSIKKINQGDLIELTTHEASLTVKVVAVRQYATFAEMVKDEEAGTIVPGKDQDDLLEILQSIYPPDKEKLGVYALQLEIVK